MELAKKARNHQWLPSLVCLYINLTVLNDTIKNIGVMAGSGVTDLWTRVSPYLSLIVLAAMMLLLLPSTKLTRRKLWFFAFSFSVLATIAFLDVDIANKYILCRDFLLGFLIPCWGVSTIDDLSLLTKSMSRLLILLIVCSISEIATSGERVYDMTFSYAVIPAAFALLYTGVTLKKALPLAAYAVATVTSILCGARGALLCHLIFVWLLVWSGMERPSILKTTLIFGVACAVGAVALYLLYQHPDLWVGSRTLRILFSEEPLYQSGRGKYYLTLLNEFMSHPLLLRGFYADRFRMAVYFSGGFQQGLYAHNIFIELLYDFGLWVIPLLFFGAMRIARAIILLPEIKKEDSGLYAWLMITLSYALGQLILSSSFLVAPSFGLLCGVLSNPALSRVGSDRPQKLNCVVGNLTKGPCQCMKD